MIPHYFHMYLSLIYHFWWDHLHIFFFLFELPIFLLSSFTCSLYILDTSPLPRYKLQILLVVCSFLSILLTISFIKLSQKCLILTVSNLSLFSYAYTLMSCLKTQGHRGIPFPYQSFIFLCFTLKSMVNFQLISNKIQGMC